MARWFSRSIRPNGNDATGKTSTVGDDVYRPGDEHGVVVTGETPPNEPPPSIVASAWSGWPSSWNTPNWTGTVDQLTDTAWLCLDLNASVLSTMPPYLLGAAPSLDAEWLRNPNPDIYTSWTEFAKQLFWDFQLGEAFVLATARYATGWPARFHAVPPWSVEVDWGADGRRSYAIAKVDVTADMLHIRYQGSVDDAHGHGPLENGQGTVVAAQVLNRYASSLASGGGIPASVLQHPDELSAEQSQQLKAQWVDARLSSIGEPAVLSGGVTWSPTQVNPKDMALVELLQFNESRIATMLGVPPFLVGLPAGGDSLTYANATALFDYHWRAGLRPKATAVMSAMSEWLLPRGTTVEVNSDYYIQPPPLERAQIAQTLNAIVDPQGNPALTVQEIREVERLDDITADTLVSGPVAK